MGFNVDDARGKGSPSLGPYTAGNAEAVEEEVDTRVPPPFAALPPSFKLGVVCCCPAAN